MTRDDPFELEVKDAFRRHFAALDPAVPLPVVRALRAGSLRPIAATRTSRALPGLAFSLVFVLAVAALVLGPSAFRGPVSATPSASQSPAQPPAQWTRLDWSRARTDPSTIEGDAPNGAWHDGWALANGGSVFFSSDGASWARTLQFPSTSVLGIVAPAPRGFVALDTYLESSTGKPVQAAVWHSDDGRSWREASTAAAFNGQNQIWDAAAGPRGIVAIGLSAPSGAPSDSTTQFTFGAWFSPDGETWQRISDPATFGNDPAFAIAATRDGFLMGGAFGGAPTIWRSPDGVHWRRIVLAPETGRRVRMIAAGAAGIIALDGLIDARDGYASRAWTSRDGSNWTRRDSADGPAWVTGDGVRISGWWDETPTQPPVPSSDSPTSTMYRHATSFDGISWAAVDDARRSWWLAYSDDEVLALDGARFHVVPVVAAATSSPRPSPSASRSPAPTATVVRPPTTPSRAEVGPPWGSVSPLGDVLLDRPRTDPSAACDAGVVAATENIVAGGRHVTSLAHLSYDGTVTREPEVAAFASLSVSVIACAREGGFIAAADGPALSVSIFTSADGLGWSRVAGPDSMPSASYIKSIVPGPNGYVAELGNGAIWFSESGSAWEDVTPRGTPITARTSLTASSSAYLFVESSDGASGATTAWLSTDGRTWSDTRLESEGSGVPRALTLRDRFLVYIGRETGNVDLTGADVVKAFASGDGRTWAAIAIPPSLVQPTVSSGSLLFAIGLSNSNPIFQSVDGEHWTRLTVAPGTGHTIGVFAANRHGLLVNTGGNRRFLAASADTNPSAVPTLPPPSALPSVPVESAFP